MNGNFVLIDAFPDAASIFNRSHRNIDQIKSDCIVALDTNVLLAPYKLGASSFREIVEIYDKLHKEKRLVLPAHVAREYARQRTAELSKLVKSLRDQSSRATTLVEANIPFLEEDASYKAMKSISDEISKKIKQARKNLDKVIDDLSDPITGDPVLKKYSSIFSECLYEYTIPDRDIFEQNCEFRFSNGVPPGYNDSEKSNNAIGDIIIWKTIIDAAKSRKQDLIFVTGDEKNDWWVRHDRTPFQPRYELLDEFARETNGQTIQIVPLHRLVEIFGGAQSAVKETEQVERTQFSESAEVVRNIKNSEMKRLSAVNEELTALRARLAILERAAALAAKAGREKVSLNIADQMAMTKNRIRGLEGFLFGDRDGPNYALATDDD